MKTDPNSQAFTRQYVDGLTKREYMAIEMYKGFAAKDTPIGNKEFTANYVVERVDALIERLNKDETVHRKE